MRFASVTAAVVLIGACVCARAETGPCKADHFHGLTCGEGPGAARVIEGTISPDKLLAFAWRQPGKAPTEAPDMYQVERVILQIHDCRPLAISPCSYWSIGELDGNTYDIHGIWDSL